MDLLKLLGGMRGATAYEWQWGRVHFRIVHLRGGYWNWKFWRRFRISLTNKDGSYS